MTTKYVYQSEDRSHPDFAKLLYEVRTVHTSSKQPGYRYFRRPCGVTGWEYSAASSARWWAQAAPDPGTTWRDTLIAARRDAREKATV